MSVIVTLRLEGDPAKLEEYAAANAGEMAAIVATATKHGLLAHRFLGADGGKIMVTDEWPDAESFQAFFDEAGGAIQKMSDGAGVSVAGQPEFWRVLESHDKYGWES
jgi:quinol monooxygenase YgiN